MKRLILGIIAAIVLISGILVAQDYVFTNFKNGYQDNLLPPGPCAGTIVKQATPVVYDRSIWIAYLCGNDQVVMRRFHHPTDNVVKPTDAPAPEPAATTPVVGSIACPGWHPACAILPAGGYPLAWADGVVGR